MEMPLEVRNTIESLSIDKIEYNDIEKLCKKLNKFQIIKQDIKLGSFWYEVEFKHQINKNSNECLSEKSTRKFISYTENKNNATKINI